MMKTTKFAVLCATLALTAQLAGAQRRDRNDAGDRRAPRPERTERPDRSERKAPDECEDCGKPKQEERGRRADHPPLEELLERFDANGNGKLDPEERDALREFARGERRDGEREGERGERRRRGERDGEREGEREGERGERRRRGERDRERDGGKPGLADLLERFDTNGNGKLDPEERDRIRELIERHREKRGEDGRRPREERRERAPKSDDDPARRRRA